MCFESTPDFVRRVDNKISQLKPLGHLSGTALRLDRWAWPGYQGALMYRNHWILANPFSALCPADADRQPVLVSQDLVVKLGFSRDGFAA